MKQLIDRIDQFVTHYNHDRKPFVWTATTDSILPSFNDFAQESAEQNTDMVALVNRSLNVYLGQWHGVMRHRSAAATMDQTDIRGLVTTVHRSVMEAASL